MNDTVWTRGISKPVVAAGVFLLTVVAIASTGKPSADESDNRIALTEASLPPRFDPLAIEAMEKQLLAEPKIKDLLYTPGTLSVTWQIGVADDGTSRIGYAGYVCQLLREKGLVDRDTNVRIVDLAKLNASPGDFRGASLGHIDCNDERDLGFNYARRRAEKRSHLEPMRQPASNPHRIAKGTVFRASQRSGT